MKAEPASAERDQHDTGREARLPRGLQQQSGATDAPCARELY